MIFALPRLASILSATLVLAAGLDFAQAEPFLNENFDRDSYVNGAPLVADGEESSTWQFNNAGGGTVLVTDQVAFSNPRAAVLKIAKQGDLAQVLAMIPKEVATDTAPMKIKVAFHCSDLQAPVYFIVRDSAGETVALVTVQVTGATQAAFENTGGRIVPLGSIAPGEWYQLVFDLPAAAEKLAEEYQVSLFAADGVSLIGSASGLPFTDQSSDAYAYFSVMTSGENESIGGASVVIDDLVMTLGAPAQP